MLLPTISRSLLRYLSELNQLRPVCVPSNSIPLRRFSSQGAREPIQTSDVTEAEEPTISEEISYEDQLKALMPSENVWSRAPFKHHKKIKDVIAELE
ncbi:hypothetical protein GCK32_021850, partial [Trichostrongylus colubriformis]